MRVRGCVLRGEDRLQAATAELLKWGFPEVLAWHTPNGWYVAASGRRDRDRIAMEGRKLKAMGTLAGVPDWVLVSPAGTIGFVELKCEGGRLSDGQRVFRDEILERGCRWALCRSVDEMRKFLEGWRRDGWV